MIVVKTRKTTCAVLALSMMASVCAAGVASAAEEEPSVTWNLPQSIKLGERVSSPYAQGKNLPTKGYFDEELGWISDYHGRITDCGEDNSLFGGREYHSYGGGPNWVEQDGTCSVGNLYVAPFAPGTFTYQFQVYRYDDSNNEVVVSEIGAPYTVTIEEAVIKTNAPEYAAAGSTFNLKTSLTNTALENQEVEPLLDPDNYTITEENGIVTWIPVDRDVTPIPAFHPTVEILEGAGLVRREEGDYSHTLESSEKLTFTGTGTVKLKVKYQQILMETFGVLPDSVKVTEFNPEMDFEGSYSPEQIITIHVTEDGQAPDGGTAENSGPDSDTGLNGSGNDSPDTQDETSSLSGSGHHTSPGTGDNGFALPLAMLAVSGGAAALLIRRRKNK